MDCVNDGDIVGAKDREKEANDDGPGLLVKLLSALRGSWQGSIEPIIGADERSLDAVGETMAEDLGLRIADWLVSSLGV